MEIKDIKKIIKMSENLGRGEKFEALRLLDKAGRSIESTRIEDKLDVLRDLYTEISDWPEVREYEKSRYLEVLDSSISDLALRKKRNEIIDSELYPSFDPVLPINFGAILRSITKDLETETLEGGEIRITFPENFLDKSVKIMESDGMGYCARGEMNPTEAYLDDSGEIQIWI